MKEFNINDWLPDNNQEQPKNNTNDHNKAAKEPSSTGKNSDLEKVISAIEARKIDLTANYADWRNIGFAFSDEFGEEGRDLFHRVSRFHPNYSTQDCNKQYDKCLKGKGQGITLKTVFYMAKEAGVRLTKPESNSSTTSDTKEEKVEHEMPTFPESLFNEIPDFLQQVVCIATSNEERDILLLGTLASISACFPKLYGVYDGKKIYPNLYLFVTAQASAGKGRLVHCKQLVKPVHNELRGQARMLKQQYELDMAEYNAKKGKESGLEKPGKPPEKMLFIPANNSTTGVFQLLSDSEGRGLIFETEGDTLAQAFKTDYGNYSDGFRKAFHHETISYYRRTDREYVDIDLPCLATVLSGTPKQIAALIPDAENGLFSRFIFYYMNMQPVWKDVFAMNGEKSLDDHFNQLGKEFYELYKTLRSGLEIKFCFTKAQQQEFNHYFSQVQDKYLTLQGIDYMATVRRLGLIAFRLCMILSALRIMESGDLNANIICDNTDFRIAMQMVQVLVKHSSRVFSELPEEEKPSPRNNKKEMFLNALPKTFNCQEYSEIARDQSITFKTAERYITEFVKKRLIHRECRDKYVNDSLN